ncbi:MAG: hypothetical protein R2693_04390 [Nocardioidaceae bacterium]
MTTGLQVALLGGAFLGLGVVLLIARLMPAEAGLCRGTHPAHPDAGTGEHNQLGRASHRRDGQGADRGVGDQGSATRHLDQDTHP